MKNFIEVLHKELYHYTDPNSKNDAVLGISRFNNTNTMKYNNFKVACRNYGIDIDYYDFKLVNVSHASGLKNIDSVAFLYSADRSPEYSTCSVVQYGILVDDDYRLQNTYCFYIPKKFFECNDLGEKSECVIKTLNYIISTIFINTAANANFTNKNYKIYTSAMFYMCYHIAMKMFGDHAIKNLFDFYKYLYNASEEGYEEDFVKLSSRVNILPQSDSMFYDIGTIYASITDINRIVTKNVHCFYR